MSELISLEQKRLVQQKIHECMAIAENYFRIKLKIPSMNFKQRGRTAGTAYLQLNEVRFNRFMLNQNPVEFIATVVPHEVAHIVVYQVYGRNVKPHGQEWRAVMEHLFNVEACRTHDFDTPRPKNVFLYQCDCQTHEFSAQRHGRASKGTRYLCRACRTELRFLQKK